jgi:hypothetical protein
MASQLMKNSKRLLWDCLRNMNVRKRYKTLKMLLLMSIRNILKQDVSLLLIAKEKNKMFHSINVFIISKKIIRKIQEITNKNKFYNFIYLETVKIESLIFIYVKSNLSFSRVSMFVKEA